MIARSTATDTQGSAVVSTRSDQSTTQALQRHNSDSIETSNVTGQVMSAASAGIPTTPPVDNVDEEDLEVQLREVQLKQQLQTMRKCDETDLELQLQEVQIQKQLHRLKKQRTSSGQSTICGACKSLLH